VGRTNDSQNFLLLHLSLRPFRDTSCIKTRNNQQPLQAVDSSPISEWSAVSWNGWLPGTSWG